MTANVADQLLFLGGTWRIGAVETDHGEVTLYFHPCLNSERDVRDLDISLSYDVRSPWRLVITATGLSTTREVTAVRLCDLIELDLENGRLTAIADLRAIVGIPRNRKGGAPNRYRSRLLSLIHSRIQNRKAKQGRNEETKAVLSEYKVNYPNDDCPSLPTAKRYLSEIRCGS